MQDYVALDGSEHAGGSHVNNNSEAFFETGEREGSPGKLEVPPDQRQSGQHECPRGNARK